MDLKFKRIVTHVGNFINLYDLIANRTNKSNLMSTFGKFVTFFHHFTIARGKEHFLLSMHTEKAREATAMPPQATPGALSPRAGVTTTAGAEATAESSDTKENKDGDTTTTTTGGDDETGGKDDTTAVGQTLIDLAKSRKKDLGNLFEMLSKFSVTSDKIDELLEEYGDYISDMFHTMRKEFTEKEMLPYTREQFHKIFPKGMKDQKEFYDGIRNALKTRFIKFDKGNMPNLVSPSKYNTAIIDILLDSSNESVFKKTVMGIYDEMLKVQVEYKNSYYFWGQYWAQISQQPNVKPQVSTVLTILIVHLGIVHKITESMKYNSYAGYEGKAKEQLDKCAKLKMVDPCIVDEYGQSLYHYAIVYKETSFFDSLVLNVDSDVSKYKNRLGKTPKDEALSQGQWTIVQNIATSQMGSRLKAKANKEEKIIEMKRGIAYQFLKARTNDDDGGKSENESKEDKKDSENENDDNKQDEKVDITSELLSQVKDDSLLEDLTLTLMKLIENMVPISDDLLLICWKYEIMKHPNKKENRLWNVIENTVKSILDNSKNRRNWMWFQQYLLKSVVWYEIAQFAEAKVDSLENGKKGNGMSNDWIQDVHCVCGSSLEIVVPKEKLSVHYLYCYECNKYIQGNIFCYMCPKGKIKEHPKYYGVCLECVEKQIEDKAKAAAAGTTTATTAVTIAGAMSGNEDSNDNSNEQNGGLLYNNLVSMTNDKLLMQKEKLKEIIEKVKMEDAHSWNDMVTFPKAHLQLPTQTSQLNLRQDNDEYITYPNRLGFDIKKLEALKLKDFYDSQIYLGKLMIVANALNDKFHSVMKEILKTDFCVDYQAGPVKRIQRCMAKTESDYAHKPYPTSAQLLDMVRCSLVYETPKDLQRGLTAVVNKIKKQDTPLKKVLRVKNLFSENKEEAKKQKEKEKGELKEDDYLYQYADIKLNVLMDYQAMSMIVEIQFLLRFMQSAKKVSHQLYEVTRNEDFVSQLNDILGIAKNKQEQLYFLIHSANHNAENMAALGQFLMNYVKEVDLGKLDEKGLNVWHYICQFGNVRMLRLLMNVTTKEEWKLYLNMPAELPNKPLCFHLAIDGIKVEMIEELRRIANDDKHYNGVLDIHCENGKKQSPMRYALSINKYEAVKALFDEKSKDISDHIDNVIRVTVYYEEDYDAKDPLNNENFEFFKKLIKVKGVDGTKAAEVCIQSNRPEYFEYVLEHNGLFEHGIKVDSIWTNIGYYPNKKLVLLMLNTKQKGFGFELINDEDKYLNIVESVARSQAGNYYQAADKKETDVYKCLELLLHNEFIIKALSKKDKVKKLISQMVQYGEKQNEIELFLEFREKHNWDVDFSPEVIGGDKELTSPLQWSIVYARFEIFQLILKYKDVFKIDFNEKYENYMFRTPILQCAESMNQYDAASPLTCKNFQMFQMLLKLASSGQSCGGADENKDERKTEVKSDETEKNEDNNTNDSNITSQPLIDLNVRDSNGCGIVALLQSQKKDKYIEYLKQECNKYGKEWNMSQEMIDSETTKYKYASEIIDASFASDYTKIKSLIDEIKRKSKQNGITISDIINIKATQSWNTAINRCISSSTKFDKEKALECDNFKVIKLLLQQPGIDVNVGNHTGGVMAHCIVSKKLEYMKHFYELSQKKLLEVDVCPRIFGVESIFVHAFNYVDMEMFKFIWDHMATDYDKFNDYNELLYRCTASYQGFDAKKPLQENDNFKMFEFLLKLPQGQKGEQKELDLTHKTDYGMNIIVGLLQRKKQSYIEYMIEEKIDRDANYNDIQQYEYNEGLLFSTALMDRERFKFLFDNERIKRDLDMNQKSLKSGNTPLLHVAGATSGYDKESPLICDNFGCFELLINDPKVDLLARNDAGHDVIDLLCITEKFGYIDTLCDKFPKTFDKTEMEKRKSNYKIANELAKAIGKNDVKLLKDILSSNKDNVEEFINLTGYYESIYYRGPALALCATSANGFEDEKQTKCSNFEMFKLLINQKGIDVNCNGCMEIYGNNLTKATALQLCIQTNKYKYIEYMMENDEKLNLNLRDNIDIYGRNALLMSLRTYKKSNWLTTFKTVYKFYCDEKYVNERGFDINHFDDKQDIGTVLSCFPLDNGYESDSPFDCERFEMITMILKHPNIDLSGKSRFEKHGLMNIIESYYNRHEYLEFVIRHSNEYKHICESTDPITYDKCVESENSFMNEFNYSIGDITTIKNHENDSLLSYAVKHHKVKPVKVLLSLNVFKDVGSATAGKDGNTLLHECASSHYSSYYEKDDSEVFDSLLTLPDLNPYIKNKHGYDCFELLKRSQKPKLLEKLNEWKDKRGKK